MDLLPYLLPLDAQLQVINAGVELTQIAERN